MMVPTGISYLDLVCYSNLIAIVPVNDPPGGGGTSMAAIIIRAVGSSSDLVDLIMLMLSGLPCLLIQNADAG